MFRQIQKTISIVILAAFITTSVKSPVYAQPAGDQLPSMPAPGVMVHLSPEFTPAHLLGITIHPDNALQFDFLIHKGDQALDDNQKKDEYKKLVKYFLASLTIPDEDQWVNLSPYEKDRIIKDDFGKTEMGRDLLAQDYLLKQITSSLIYPEDGLGKKFWDRVYERAYKEYGATDIPVNTFNKVWIIPDEAAIYESGNTAYVLRNHLKVMLEEDYLSLDKHTAITQVDAKSVNKIGSQIVREIVLPELEKEVNEGKNFANLRQIYSGMILATWYKHVLWESLLGKIYANQVKVKGVDQDPQNNEIIYRQYLKAFKKGVFNYIKEDVDKYTNEAIPRKYFSGGAVKGYSFTAGFNKTLIREYSDRKPPSPALLAGLPDVEDIDRAIVALNASTDQDVAMTAKKSEDFGEIKKIVFGTIMDDIGKDTFLELPPHKRADVIINKLAETHKQLPAGALQFLNYIGTLKWADASAVRVANLRRKKNMTPDLRFLEEVLTAKEISADAAMTTKQRTAVVVDDDLALLDINKDVLQAQGFNVLTASNKDELKKVMAEHGEEVSLLLTDTTGWVGDVKEALSKVKGQIRIIAVSGEDDRKIWDSQNVPIDDFLGKPYGIKQLEDAVAKIFPKDAAMEALPEEVTRILQRVRDLHTSLYSYTISAKHRHNTPLQTDGVISQIKAFLEARQRLSVDNLDMLKQLLADPRTDYSTKFHEAEGFANFLSSRQEYSRHFDGQLGEFIKAAVQLRTKDHAIKINRIPPAVDRVVSSPFGGIDLNAANLNLQIKRDGNGVPLPLAQQDMSQLNSIQGFVPEIIEIVPAVNVPIISELQQKLQATSV